VAGGLILLLTISLVNSYLEMAHDS